MSHQYERPEVLSKEEIVGILNSYSTPEEKVNAIVGAVNSIQDQEWLQELCLHLSNHKEQMVAGAAINGLGDIARIFGELDVKLVSEKLNAIRSERKDLIGKIDDALDDIRMFIK